MAKTAVVKMQGIRKAFGTNLVLHGVDFTLMPGSVHALLGENGTGKTTLMNILGGVLAKDAGELAIDGRPVEMQSPSMAAELGIAFIHQELTLINDLNVYENLFLGKELKKGPALDRAEMRTKAREILERMNVELSPDTRVSELNASYKQIVEIARALLQNARVIIMDEPTTSLTDVEIEHIFSLVRGLKKQDVSFVFISHKLNEVVALCDSYTVMRDGRVVASGDSMEGVDENMLARHMVGKELSYSDLYRPRKLGDTILEIRGLSREREFSDVSMHVRAGEIVGVTGLLGDGRSDVFATVFGCKPTYQGEILVEGKPVRMRSTTLALRRGISYLPRNRKENGIVKDLTVAKNMSLSILKKLRRGFFVDRRAERESNQKYVDSLRIKLHELSDPITSLSGGNQQKAVLAKALGPEPKLVILDNPTQGVDVGAKLEIYSILMELAEKGMSFVVLSSEAQEILRVCDRVYVMYHGKVRQELARADANEESIMVAATGGSIAG